MYRPKQRRTLPLSCITQSGQGNILNPACNVNAAFRRKSITSYHVLWQRTVVEIFSDWPLATNPLSDSASFLVVAASRGW